MVGQVCFAPGEAKNTYGTGNFMLLNTGEELVRSENGLLTTVCYQFGDDRAGLRAGGLDRGHRLGRAVAARPARHHLRRRRRSRRLARQVEDNGGVYFVPAFSGLFAPYWRSRRPRRDRRAVPVQHQRPPGPGHPGGDLLPEPRRRRGDGAGLRRAPRGAQGRRRRHGQRACACRCRPTSSASRSAGRSSPRPPRSAPPTPPAWPSGSGRTPTSCARTGTRSKRWEPEWNDEQRADGYAGWKKAVERTLDWVDVD